LINEFWPQLEQPSRYCGLRTGIEFVFHQRQEDQLGSLDLVTNVHHPVEYPIYGVCSKPASAGRLFNAGKDVPRLSPLIHEHINMLGRYWFAVPDADAVSQRVS